MKGMGDEKDAFYVVRKGDIIGIYKSSADCQAQAAASVIFFFFFFILMLPFQICEFNFD